MILSDDPASVLIFHIKRAMNDYICIGPREERCRICSRPLHSVIWCRHRDTTASIVAIWVKTFQTETTIGIQLVRPTEVCGQV